MLRASRSDAVRYVESGVNSGPSYLLLHGLGGSLEQWHEVQRQLGQSAHVVSVDIPGFGQSRKSGGQFDVSTAADAILAFCRELDLQDCVLVSHSIGSVIAGLLAARGPDIFARVIFVSGTLFRASEIAQKPLRAFRYRRLGAAVAGQFSAGLFPVPPPARRMIAHSKVARQLTLWPFVAHPQRLDPTILEAALVGSGSPAAVLRILRTAKSIDYAAIISAVRQPVDLIWGDQDRLIAEDDLRRMRNAVTIVRERRVSDCGHWVMIENPVETADFIRGR